MALLTTPDSVHVNARWAPMTSLSSRLTSAPVRVRVKKATGMRCTWRNTARRRSRIRPSPILADCQRSAMPTTASSTAMRAMITASVTTRPSSRPSTISSTTRPARTGVATVSTAPTTLRARNPAERPPVRPGEVDDAAQRGAVEPAPGLLTVHGALQRHPVAEVHLHAGSLLLQGCLRSTAFHARARRARRGSSHRSTPPRAGIDRSRAGVRVRRPRRAPWRGGGSRRGSGSTAASRSRG